MGAAGASCGCCQGGNALCGASSIGHVDPSKRERVDRIRQVASLGELVEGHVHRQQSIDISIDEQDQLVFDAPRAFGDCVDVHASEPAQVGLFKPGALVPLHGSGNIAASLESHYTLDPKPFARGSYGSVSIGIHKETGTRRAIKSVVKRDVQRCIKNAAEFVRREVEILREADHPNIIRMYEAFEDEECLHLVLELCEGGDLLERIVVGRDRMPEQDCAELVMQMVGAVFHLNQRGILHRDLKPENFMFTRREPQRDPLPPKVAPLKLIDFGLSRKFSAEVGAISPKIGTTEYMAPEVFCGVVTPELVDRADMWSLGVLLHVMFIGHYPSSLLIQAHIHEYFSLECWSGFSSSALDLLAQLLSCSPQARPTISMVLRHPWVAAARNRDVDDLPMRSRLPNAIRLFAAAPSLRRIALNAAARELDDRDLFHLRRLFRSLELECDGTLTQKTLARASCLRSDACAVASELLQCFDYIDVDGSGSVDWTELVAASLSTAGFIGRAEGTEKWIFNQFPEELVFDDTGHSSAPELTLDLPALTDDACWRAFDLLSQSSGAVSDLTLCRLLLPEGWLSGDVLAPLSERTRFQEYVDLAAQGRVTAVNFAKLIIGKYDL